jgi:hypothetical protein
VCSQEKNQQKQAASLPPASAGFLHCFLFDREDGGDMSLRNVVLSPKDKALQPTFSSTSF